MEVFKGLHAFIWHDNRENNCNAFLIEGEKNILIDPGHQHLFRHVEKGLLQRKLTREDIDTVIITHGHPDHLEGANLFSAPTLKAMDEGEYRMVKKLAGSYFKVPEMDYFLQEGDLKIGAAMFEVIHSPGHSPGSICLYWPEKKVLFTGDVVFREGIGRTDLPGGDGSQLKESIKKIAKLDVEYLLTGHGDIVVGREAVRENFRMIVAYWFQYL
jgi:glyoxylase-like metal-dependent hydrolase (beta-lactamase superfamily II)